MTSSLLNLPIKVRDEGEAPVEEFLGDVYETQEQIDEARKLGLADEKTEIGHLIVVPHPGFRGALMPRNWKPASEGRQAWPSDAVVFLRDRVRHGDAGDVQRIQNADKQQYLSSHPEDKECERYIPAYTREMCWTALFLHKFSHGESLFWEDPRTMRREMSEELGEEVPVPGTGKILEVPRGENAEKDIYGTLDLLKDIVPPAVTAYLYQTIEERAISPLPGTQPHASQVKEPEKKKTGRKTA